MSFENLNNSERIENILRYIIQASQADGVFHNSEYIYLLQLARSLNYPEGKLALLLKEDNARFLIPKSEMERMEIIYYLFFLIKVDRQLQPEEEDMIHKFGLKLGFRPMFMHDIINLLKKYLDGKLPQDAILEEAKKYLN